VKRTLVSVVLLSSIAVGFYGCGSGDGSGGFFQPGGPSGPGGGGGSSQQQTYAGRAVLRPIAVIEESQRAGLLRLRTTIEQEGVQLTDDGQFVIWPQTVPAGWTAKLGSQTVLVDVDGTFAFTQPSDGAVEGTLIHPSDPSIQYRFTLAQLGQSAPLILPVLFRGPCGMQASDTDTFCAPREPVAPRQENRTKLVGIDPQTLRPVPRPFHIERQMKAGPLGSEPNPLQGPTAAITRDLLQKCAQQDGAAQNNPDAPEEAKYFFSTCHDLVKTNACLNENDLSDQFEAVIRTLDPLAISRLVGVPFVENDVRADLILLRVPTGSDFNFTCYQNHKHRNCGQINIGDVSCKLPDGTILKPTGASTLVSYLLEALGTDVPGFATVEIEIGSTQELTLHNNGAYGITRIRKFKDEAQGELGGDAIATGRDGVSREVRHFLPLNYNPDFGTKVDADAYIPDIKVRYTMPGNAKPGDVDSYQFLVDDRYVVVTFKAVAGKPFLRRLGSTTELSVHDLNAGGAITTTREGKTLLEPLGAERIELLPEPGKALINDEGTCIYQADDHQEHAKYRFPEGETLDLVPPAGSQSAVAQGVLALSPQGFYFCKAKRGDGKNDIYTYTGEEDELGAPRFLSAPEQAGSGELTVIQNTSENALYANGDGGTAQPPSPFAGLKNAGRLARYNFDTSSWSTTVVEPRADALPLFVTRYVDASTNSVLRFSQRNDFSPATPPQGVSWFSYFGVLVQSGASFVIRQESAVESDGGSRTVLETAQPVPNDGKPWSSHSVVALNDAGEVAGSINDAQGTRHVLFPVSGAPVNVATLLPPGSPVGTWKVLRMAGRFMVLEHTTADDASIYLWFRGTVD
jgi:hypothetical protein